MGYGRWWWLSSREVRSETVISGLGPSIGGGGGGVVSRPMYRGLILGMGKGRG
jgi:hypothetical protein